MTFEDLINDLQAMNEVVRRNLNSWREQALFDYEGKQKQRIFGSGEANDNTPIETRPAQAGRRGAAYTLPYEKVRRAKGRQISIKDLEFNGDLRRSIQVGTFQGVPVYGFIIDKKRVIAQELQDYAKKEVFNVSDADAEFMLDVLDIAAETTFKKAGLID